jgi:hypothetical protein
MPTVTGQLQRKGVADTISLLDSLTDAVAHTVNSPASGGIALPRPSCGFVFELDVTAAAAAIGDTLDVKVQTSLDGVNWIDVCHFTQVLGNGGVKHHIATNNVSIAQATFENGTALAAGQVRNIFGDLWRVTYTIVDGGAHGQSFTFNVNACPF